MRKRQLGWIPVMAVLSLSTATAATKCKILETRPIPVTMQGLRPTILTKINGVKARFILDSGAFYSVLSPAAVAQYKLVLRDTASDDSLWGRAYSLQNKSSGYNIQGFGGGETTAKVTTVKTFTYAGVTLPNVQFLVGGNDIGGDTVGELGDNLLRIADTEYDFADGMIRLAKPVHCGDQPLIFWAKPGQHVAVVQLRDFTDRSPQIIGRGSVNGHRISIYFDTGVSQSILSLSAAKRAGITPHNPGVVPAGDAAGVAGNTVVRLWNAPIADLRIGTEKIEHTHLLIGNTGDADLSVREGRADMIVGEDFFLSHHIFVSYEQHKLYFTYTGGPVFDLGQPSSEWKHAPAAAAGTAPATPANAATLISRGVAYAAQREFHLALADLVLACRHEPKNANCRYQRGLVYRQLKQPGKALEDFDTAIRLQPDNYRAHLQRAEVLLWASKDLPPDERAGAGAIKADLDAVSRLNPPESNLRLALSSLYDDNGQYSAAIRQVDLWLPHHRRDQALASALDDRCWERAEIGLRLRKALHDCDRALDLEADDPDILDSRGLVYLRLGRLADAIDDYDSALRNNPKMPTSLYGRGLAELREGKKVKGEADLAAAKKLDAGVAKRFARMGLKP